MRIGCLQFAPAKGDVGNNLARADVALLRAEATDLDLIVLPEMAFTGYNFSSLCEIAPHLEPSGTGITSIWARTTALRHGCTVVCPYPEKALGAGGPENHSSAVVATRDGRAVGHYRKSHLYATDGAWAVEGTGGFYHDELPGLGSVAMGLSVDMNPRRFETPWHAFELAFHALDVRARLLIIPMAWPTNGTDPASGQSPGEPDMEVLMYWVSRVEPLIRAEAGAETVVVFANRSGAEGGVVYAGTSAVLGIRDGEVRVYGLLGRSDGELLVVDTEAEPYARLVYRPRGNVAEKDSRGFYGDETSMAPVHPSRPLPLSPRMQSAPPSPSTLGSPRTDSNVQIGNEPATPPAASLPRPLPVPTKPPPQQPRSSPPKLSLQTGLDTLSNCCTCTCTPALHSATTAFCISPDHAVPPGEAITARKLIDTKVHPPTPHPLASRPSPAKLFQRATARVKDMANTGLAVKHPVQRGGWRGSEKHAKSGGVPAGVPAGMDGSGPSFGVGVARAGESPTQPGREGKEVRCSPRPGGASIAALPPRRCLAITSERASPARRSWSPIQVPNMAPSPATNLRLQGRAPGPSPIPRGSGPMMASTPPGDDYGLKALGMRRPVHELPDPGHSLTEFGAPGWI